MKRFSVVLLLLLFAFPSFAPVPADDNKAAANPAHGIFQWLKEKLGGRPPAAPSCHFNRAPAWARECRGDSAKVPESVKAEAHPKGCMYMRDIGGYTYKDSVEFLPFDKTDIEDFFKMPIYLGNCPSHGKNDARIAPEFARKAVIKAMGDVCAKKVHEKDPAAEVTGFKSNDPFLIEALEKGMDWDHCTQIRLQNSSESEKGEAC